MLAPAVEGTAAATAQLQELLAKDMKYVTVADLSEALEGGADVNGTVGGRGGRDWTALMHASENGDCDVVEQLLKREAAVDDLIAAARAEAARAGVGGLELEDDDGGAAAAAAPARRFELVFDGPLGVRASLMRDKDRKTTHVIVDEVLGACPHAGEVAALDEIATVAGEPLDVDGAGDDAATFAAVLERIQRAPRRTSPPRLPPTSPTRRRR